MPRSQRDASAGKFNVPPGWPLEAGFQTPTGWRPDPSWPPPPPGWVLWLPKPRIPRRLWTPWYLLALLAAFVGLLMYKYEENDAEICRHGLGGITRSNSSDLNAHCEHIKSVQGIGGWLILAAFISVIVMFFAIRRRPARTGAR